MKLLLATLIVVVTAALSPTAMGKQPLAPQIADAIIATWNCQDKLPVARSPQGESPWKLGHHSRGYRQALFARWVNRMNGCLAVLHERARQWNWQAFLPPKWQRVAVCETGMNWFHHNGKYVSAFGISRQAYDQDAAVYGVPRWDDRKIPSPWQQYQAALGHYKLHGGFSGWGCRGA